MTISSVFSSQMGRFLTESDGSFLPSHCRSLDLNSAMLKTLSNDENFLTSFDADSTPKFLDSGTSSCATSDRSLFIDGTHKPLKGVMILGIASGLEASGIGSIKINIVDDNCKAVKLQIDRVLHLKDLPHTSLSPYQIIQQHRSLRNSFALHDDQVVLSLDYFKKTIQCDFLTNLLMLCTESGVNELHNMIQDGSENDSLIAAQISLSCWHRLLPRMDFERIKDFVRKGFLPKEIAN